MIKKIIYLTIIPFLFFSCSSIYFLPEQEEIGENEFGGFIKLKTFENERAIGELLAISNDSLYLIPYDLRYNSDILVISTPVADIKSYTVSYALPKDYSWTIPVFALSTLSHGFFLLLTAPINIGITTGITLMAKKDFSYSSEQISIKELNKFTRYPQGLPDGFKKMDIEKYNDM